MKKKNYDDGTPGIVGSVLQNLGGHLLVQADYYIDRSKKKIPLKGVMFAVHDVVGLVNCFAGDSVKIGKSGVTNLTEKITTCDFSSMLSKEEIELLKQKNQNFLFNGFIEQINILDNEVAIRFRVTSRVNSDGVKLRVDKLVSYCKRGGTMNSDNHFLNTIFSVPVKKALSVRYSLIIDGKSRKLLENVALLGVTPMQNAKTFLKKNC